MRNPKPSSPEVRQQAVALRYDTQDAAPKVVAKAYGTLAESIIRTAKEHGLYIHESPELLSLLMQVDLDQQIPPQLYQVIAELLAWLYALEQSHPKAELVLAASPTTPAI